MFCQTELTMNKFRTQDQNDTLYMDGIHQKGTVQLISELAHVIDFHACNVKIFQQYSYTVSSSITKVSSICIVIQMPLTIILNEFDKDMHTIIFTVIPLNLLHQRTSYLLKLNCSSYSGCLTHLLFFTNRRGWSSGKDIMILIPNFMLFKAPSSKTVNTTCILAFHLHLMEGKG